jgi:hypothetical protein
MTDANVPDDVPSGDEEDMMRLLGLAVAQDQVPDQVVAAAKGSYTWRTIDAELAELAYDSLLDSELAGVRGDDSGRALSFEYGSVTIELDVDVSNGVRVLEGQVSPSPAVQVEVQHANSDGTWSGSADDHGRFSFQDIPPGPVRLFFRFSPSSGPAMLLTEWVTI